MKQKRLAWIVRQSRIFPSLRALLIAVLALGSSGTYSQDEPRKGSFDWSLDEEKGIIRLNTDDPSYSPWRTPRDRSNDPAREPGPINLSRTSWGGPFVGIPTFYRRPVALFPEDLTAGDVDVAFIGMPLDFNSMRRGAAFGPQAVRTGETAIHWDGNGDASFYHTEVVIDPLAVLNVVDYGDAPVEPFNLERSIGASIPFIRETAETGVVLLIAGGSHSVPYPVVRGIVEANGGLGSVGLIHFDAHYDSQPYGLGHSAHYGNFIKTLINDKLVKPEHMIQVGQRGASGSKTSLELQRAEGIKSYHMEEIRRYGFEEIAKRILKDLEDFPDMLYVSLDLDFYDASAAPGTTVPVPGGVMPVDFFPLLRAMGIQKHVVGMDIVEIAPMLDNRGGQTMLLANRSFYEMMTGIALRKNGITDPWYIHPDLIPEGKYEE